MCCVNDAHNSAVSLQPGQGRPRLRDGSSVHCSRCVWYHFYKCTFSKDCKLPCRAPAQVQQGYPWLRDASSAHCTRHVLYYPWCNLQAYFVPILCVYASMTQHSGRHLERAAAAPTTWQGCPWLKDGSLVRCIRYVMQPLQYTRGKSVSLCRQYSM